MGIPAIPRMHGQPDTQPPKWKAEGRLPNRPVVPNGSAGSREEIDKGRAEARAFAKSSRKNEEGRPHRRLARGGGP
jgi:hypothetical protein